METTTYVRKQFSVEAVEATAENLADIAEWCGGELIEEEIGKFHVKIKVKRSQNERQTRCYIGDWMLKSPQGFKVFLARPFHQSFELPTGVQKDAAVQASKPQPDPDAVNQAS